jgi:hypothetical protein
MPEFAATPAAGSGTLPPPGRRPDPVLVFGAPRSGTTYLEQLLNAHPDVYISHETRVFTWVHHALEVLPQRHNILLNHREEFVQHLRAVFPGVIRDFYAQLAPDVSCWGDKNPHYANPHKRCMETAAELFPGSLFVHLVRDGRDVVSSLVRKETEGIRWATFDQAHVTWRRMVDRGSDFCRSLPPDRGLELRYEDLVADDLGVAAELFRFLGLTLDPQVREFCEGQRAARTPFKEPTRDLSSGAAGSDWSDLFDAEQRAHSLDLIGPQLLRLGYETEDSLAALRGSLASGPDS